MQGSVQPATHSIARALKPIGFAELVVLTGSLHRVWG